MRYHLIIYVPVPDAPRIREALARAGAGTLGNYDTCSFSSRGIGRFRPLKGAHPAIGTVGTVEEVEEERIEAMLEVDSEDALREVLSAMTAVHPYEQPAIHVLPMATL